MEESCKYSLTTRQMFQLIINRRKSEYENSLLKEALAVSSQNCEILLNQINEYQKEINSLKNDIQNLTYTVKQLNSTVRTLTNNQLRKRTRYNNG